MSTICIFRDKESAEAVRNNLTELRILLSQRAKSMFLCTIIMDVYSMIRNQKIKELTKRILEVLENLCLQKKFLQFFEKCFYRCFYKKQSPCQPYDQQWRLLCLQFETFIVSREVKLSSS